MTIKNILTGGLVSGLLLAGAGHAADIQERTFKLALQTNPGTAQYDGVEKFAQLLEQKSDGKLKVKIFGGGSLGKDTAVVSSMQGGVVEMALMNASLLNGVVPEFSVFDFPYLFDNEQEAYAVLDGPVGKALSDKLPDKGLVGLGYPELGFRHMHNRVRPVKTAEDLKGLKMRVIETPVYVDFVNALGANATPIPFPEVYTSLETGTVDGATNPLITITVMKFDEVQKYLTLTRHMYNPQIILMSKKTWDKLSEDERALVQEAASEAIAFERQVSQEKNAQALEELKKTLEITELPPEEIAKLREAAKPVIEKHTRQVGEDLVKQVYAEIDKARGK
ncbi:MAG: TRAP transporter substrate-binding protein [Pseudomonadota bacterium]|nr:TRAP transporter substrate-binding protein [Pseudomonadota bacterium]